MKRRHFHRTILGGLLAVLMPLQAVVAGDEAKQKVVYHVADVDKVAFALGNIRNHIAGMGGPDAVDIVLVAHGPGVKAFNDLEADPKVKERVAALQEDGVEFEVCGNTLKALGMSLFDLVPGFERVDQGGVVRIAQLQQQGYLYIRP